jgi:hypothetical protein
MVFLIYFKKSVIKYTNTFSSVIYYTYLCLIIKAKAEIINRTKFGIRDFLRILKLKIMATLSLETISFENAFGKNRTTSKVDAIINDIHAVF